MKHQIISNVQKNIYKRLQQIMSHDDAVEFT